MTGSEHLEAACRPWTSLEMLDSRRQGKMEENEMLSKLFYFFKLKNLNKRRSQLKI